MTGPRSVWGLKYRASDDATYILGNYYSSPTTVQNSLSLMKLDGVTSAVSEIRFEFSGSAVPSSMLF